MRPILLKIALPAAALLMPLSACMTAVEEGARGLKLAALDVKDKAADLKDTALDARDGAADFFDVPEAYHGRGQAVCGYLSYEPASHNIYPDAAAMRNKSKGFGVLPGTMDHQVLLRHHGQYVCLTGEVFYRGCGTEIDCSSSNFSYAVRADAIDG